MMKYLLHITLLSIFCVGLISCDDVELGLEENQTDDVVGLWKERSNNIFLLISNSEFNFYEYNASLDCVTPSENTVISRDGTGFFQVQSNDSSSPRAYAVTNESGDLKLRTIDDPDLGLRFFWPSTVDITSKSICVLETDIEGQWAFTQNEESTYIAITTDSVTVHSQDMSENCYEMVEYRIDGRTGNIYKLIDQVTEDITTELFLEMRRTADGLEISLENDDGIVTDLYTTTSVDFNTLAPDCGSSIPNQFQGVWEQDLTGVSTPPQLHLEVLPDTLRYFTEQPDQSCKIVNNHVVQARRGNSYFLSDDANSPVNAIYELLFDNDVLITRISGNNSTFDERFISSSTTLSQLEASICTATN